MSTSNHDGPTLDEWKNWDEKSKQKFLAAVEDTDKPKKVWYCKRGRKCDGKPHGEYDYPHARGDQWPPPGNDWLVWANVSGRGVGKTRSGAEWIRKISESITRTSIIGPTLPHVRDTMVEGESGLLACFDNAKMKPLWEPSKRRITLPCKCKNTYHRDGHIIQAFTGEEPERLRGPQHGGVWLDEPAHFSLIEPTWDNMMLGLRLGKNPKVYCTTTPLPTKWMKELLKAEDTVVVRVSTYVNLDNLAAPFRKTVLSKYEGTRLGRQELHGEILEDIEGALWTMKMIEDTRVKQAYTAEDMDRIIIGIDPAGTSSKKRDQTGIIVVGKKGDDFYVLADYSGHYTPDGWASQAWKAFDDWNADKIVAEKNYGGEMVLSTLRNSRPHGPAELVHSRRGKQLRAEPVVSLYEQERVHHNGLLEELEAQMTEWVPDLGASPDRVDALVHAITKLSSGGGPASYAVPGRNSDSLKTSGSNLKASGDSLFGYKPRQLATR